MRTSRPGALNARAFLTLAHSLSQPGAHRS